MAFGKFKRLVALFVLLGISKAWGFDYARYQAADLDDIMEQHRPQAGVDIHPALPLKLNVALAAYAEDCQVGILKKTMIAAGISNTAVEALPVSRCIKVRSGKSRILSLFIQDPVAEFLRKEVTLGSQMTLYAIHVFTDPDGPGLLVNEFAAATAGNAAALSVGKASGCGCGTPDFHPGTDYSTTEGTPVLAAEDGVVVKAEDDEQALVDTPTAGRCGRYVVLEHSYPNGRSTFTRYAQLGRVVGGGDKPLVVGSHVTKKDKIGEIGSSKTLHFEVRPVEPATMDTGASWSQRYGADPAMQWSRFRPVDPTTFDFAAFGGTSGDAK
jgi:hypothetical protein